MHQYTINQKENKQTKVYKPEYTLRAKFDEILKNSIPNILKEKDN